MAIDSKTLKKRVRKELLPFVRTSLKGLDQLAVLESVIPSKIAEIYEAVQNTRKWRYRRVKKLYSRLVRCVQEHNDAVTAIFSRLDSINLEDLYNKAGEVSDEEAKDLYDFTTKAYRFYVAPNNPRREKLEAVRVFGYKIKDIRAQWALWRPFVVIKESIDEDEFIDNELAVFYESEERKARKAVENLKYTYYPFRTFPAVVDLIRKHNHEYLDKLATDPLFDDIGGVSLDKEQRRAAVTPERTALVIAGAGSGKTTTICGRVRFLLERRGVLPEEILLLSYSKKSADDLAAKMALIDPALSVGTFHKIGLDILKEATKLQQTVEEQWDAIIEEYFREEMAKDPVALRRILTYYALFLNNVDSNKKYANAGDLYTDLKKEDFVTFKESFLRYTTDPNNLETIKKERVKSFEELAIANFYFINGIQYQYERSYEYDVSTPERRQYTPDFYLKDYGIYHEHFGIDAEGRAKQFKGAAEREYVRGVEWKRECHQLHRTSLIETTSAEFSDGTVFERLEEELKSRGVEFHPLPDDMVQQAIESVYSGQSFKSFINLVKSFLSLYKSRYEDASAFETLKKTEFLTQYMKARADLFLTICEGIYAFYMKRIRSENKIDFDDMILQSTKVLPLLEGFRYRHVIVDEFQDISYSRAAFLKMIIAHGKSSLFAVGDDWQSIYRFSGCDVNILLNFEEYFGQGGRYFIGNVHRNSQQLQDAAKKFIEANSEQIRKQIHAEKSLEHPIRVVYYRDEGISALNLALQTISSKEEDANVLLLGRNNKDINPFFDHRFYWDRVQERPVSKDFPNLTLSYSTVHGSKGLEADYVILLSAKDSKNGFPNRTEDDSLLNLVMSKPSLFPFAEERRLWYVALTRTRSYVFILVPVENPSSFIEEMKGDYLAMNPDQRCDAPNQILCPRCKTGHLVLREKEGRQFYGCSNYPYCTYTISDMRAVERNKRCPVCGDFMIYREGKFGPFFSCRRFPRCGYHETYNPGD